ncbi:two component transcriptional regulator, winged helix family [Kosmotoga olearia TBF 19.5.1]|uniref:Two component transcriptional regulator, winged helix family n=1 Tax=Kosmotoga olearia (strain ATCC BAA-1733 / DSM 21960 / TBF 19.5.1) TaxID=521045 RepID=C5CGA7_KOSOT|nr:response regulator transcription factor [Kosmotoga olearia]ACR79548.1 two component transcriptional regulator, winged helix family [Kosmotoga olearia TBF 19.5.1]
MKKILLVEDDETLAMGIKYALEQEAFLVEVATELESARKRIDEKDFDLILLDVMLPNGNGFQLCKEIRTYSDLPIIFLTARDEEVNIVMGLELGADDYITKPFKLKELVARIRANLRRIEGKKTVNRYLISGQIRLDIVNQKLMVEDAEQHLTPVEFRLLFALMDNAGRILTRDQLLGYVWNTESDFVDDNTLSVHIRKLREKIEDDPSKPEHILTVRGLGYRWRE